MTSRPDPADIAEFGAFRFERSSGFLFKDDQEIPLPPRAASVLDRLLEEPGALVTKDELLDSVWEDAAVTEYSLVEAVKVVRGALDDEGPERQYVQTVHGRGYRFVAPVRFVGAADAGPEEDGPQDSLPALVAQLRTRIVETGRRHQLALILLAVGLLLGGLWGWMAGRSQGSGTSPPTRPVHLSVALPDDAPLLALGRGSTLDVSDDGERIAYVAQTAEGRSIFVLRTERPGAVAVPGTEDALMPTFSPDGRQIAFFAGGGNRPLQLKKTSLESGETVSLGIAGRIPSGTHWGVDGYIYFTPDDGFGVHRVPEEGGELETVTATNTDPRTGEETTHLQPQLLAEGRRLLFTVHNRGVAGESETRLVTRSLESGEETVVLEGAGLGRLLTDDILVFVRDGDLWATRLDPDSFTVAGSETRILTDVDVGLVSFSNGGLLAYMRHDAALRPVWLDRQGHPSPVPGSEEGCLYPSLGPGDRIVSLTCPFDDGFEILLLDALRGTGTRLTFDGGNAVGIWTPSADRIVYSSVSDGRWTLSSRSFGGGTPATVILTSEHPVYPQDVSPDGRVLIFQRIHPDTGEGIWTVPLAGDGDPEPLVDSRFHESGARLSPDGSWLAYHSNEAGGWHVYARSLLGPNRKVQVSAGGGGWPVWTRDGDELLYLTNRGEAIMSVTVANGDEPSFGIPRQLFAAPVAARDRRGPVFDATSDGSRIVMTAAPEIAVLDRLNLMWGWLDRARDGR